MLIKQLMVQTKQSFKTQHYSGEKSKSYEIYVNFDSTKNFENLFMFVWIIQCISGKFHLHLIKISEIDYLTKICYHVY